MKFGSLNYFSYLCCVIKLLMKKLILKYLNRQYPFDNGYIIYNNFNIDYIKDDLKSVFGEDILEEFNIFNDWLYVLFPDKVIKVKNSTGAWSKRTFDNNGNKLTYENSTGFWYKSTYDSNGNQLSYESSNGGWSKSTFDNNGNILTFEDSCGFWYKKTFDDNGNRLSYADSEGFKN